ncbi:MAG: hypothetical protein QOK04_2029, partial [Solirubrobacteraceae bacterium]|nr:hypothetical protein [Solirubrobacteraceae bacterium]
AAHTMFVSGNDEGAKKHVKAMLRQFGWAEDAILDLGDIGAARGQEMYLPLWLRLYGASGTGHLNVSVVAAG